MKGDSPNKIVPKHKELWYTLHGILEPENVTETKPWQFAVFGNRSVGADVVNVVAERMVRGVP